MKTGKGLKNELNNMSPAVMGGEDQKKDGEVEEYFMSVNHHKKSLR